MNSEHVEQLKRYDDTEQELERAIAIVREQRREYINQHNLNMVNDNAEETQIN
ncbi:hypothetical protein [Gilliamella sp. Choc4-2]|uniref:hypothetical protein n=1 Tax=Gilliamella sp. Choc4-2 TaxID=3120237 RepID=UPI00159EC90B|nr:hypothetical protein [Gilliamella apicola]